MMEPVFTFRVYSPFSFSMNQTRVPGLSPSLLRTSTGIVIRPLDVIFELIIGFSLTLSAYLA